MKKHSNKIIEFIVEKAFLLCAFASILAVALIMLFIFKEGLPMIIKYGINNFLGGMKWKPSAEVPQFGIFPMIIGSICVTFGALVVGVPIGLSSAIYLAEFADKRIVKILRPAIELLAGIPSVVYGFYGIVVIVPLVRRTFPGGGPGILTASIILGVMILPTIINISEVSIRAIPSEYKHGSLALGASLWQTVIKVLVPAARSGIITAIILGLGRAIGETMAVIMIAGNTPQLPEGVFTSIRTLTANIAIEMAYASGDHLQALFATGVVLFVFIMILNILVNLLPRKVGE